MISLCVALIVTGIIFGIMGMGGSIGLKIPQIGYIGGPTGVILIVLGILLQIVGVC